MLKKTIKIVGCFCILFFLCTIAVIGQCKEEMRGGEKVIVCDISETNPFPLGSVRVPNQSRVIIKITNKSPFDECELTELKLTPIVEPDPIEKMLILFAKGFGGLPAAGAGGGVPALVTVAPRFAPPATLAEKLYDMTKQLKEDFTFDLKRADITTKRQKLLLDELNNFIKYAPRNSTDFNNARVINGTNIKSGTVLISDLFTELNRNEIYELELRTSNYNSIRKQVEKLNDLLVPEILQDLDEINSNLTKYKSVYEAMENARAIFKSNYNLLKDVQDELIAGKDPFSQELIAALPFTQQSAQRNVICKNSSTKKSVFSDPVPIAFLFKKDSPLSVSVGVLLSTSAKQKLGITQINTGTNSSPSFRNEFAVVDRASYQVIPFGFINYRLMYFGSKSNVAKPPDFSLNISAGVGVNPNSGTNEIEYFIGPSIGYKRFFIQFGDHIGRFQKGFTGGFNIGDTVPANFPSALPIQKEYRHRFGIAFSYRLF
jgi:hypothetical protein